MANNQKTILVYDDFSEGKPILLGKLFVNPVPYGDELSLNVNEDDNRISISLAIETAKQFGIQQKEAQLVAESILTIVRDNWEKTAVKYGISRGKIEDMRPAFSACYE